MEHTYLGRIVAAHRQATDNDQRSLDELHASARQAPPARGLAATLRKKPPAGAATATSIRPAVIAEIKRRSPSKGDLRPGLDAASLAREYAGAGAAALSVLTDEEFFGGCAQDLISAREASDLATLRKDFTVSERDVLDARIMGADAILLIVAALSKDELIRFADLASELGMDALVEIHSEPELEQALAAGAKLIGVNQRDLHTFEVDNERAQKLSEQMPDDIVRVAESGIRNADDMCRLGDAGYHAALVGETLVTSADPAGTLAELLGSPDGG